MDSILNLYLESKSTLESNINAELEVKFGTRNIKKITKQNFDNVIKYLLSNNFNFKNKNNYYLRISIDDTRVEINNLTNIQEFCKNNQLNLENNSTSFYTKNKYNEESIQNFDDFNFRITYNLETKLNNDNPKVQSLIENWSNLKKFYRLINRFTLVNDSLPFNIDLSIVRESGNIEINNKLSDGNIFNINEKYEIEIEANNDNINNISSDILELMLKKVIKFIMSGLQETNYPIGQSEINEIIQEYYNLSKGDNYKINKIEPKDFIGPSSSTLQLINISIKNEDSDVVNIRKNYTVTEKADGERKLLYISQKGKIYLITTNLNIQFTGSQTKNKKLFNTIIDGEHILYNKNGEFINLYASFDLYYINGKDIRNLEFVPSEESDLENKFRLPLLSNVISSIEAKLIGTNNLPPIRIDIKKFYETNSRQSIFQACNLINKNIYEYETDGLIFTPKNIGVGLV